MVHSVFEPCIDHVSVSWVPAHGGITYYSIDTSVEWTDAVFHEGDQYRDFTRAEAD